VIMSNSKFNQAKSCCFQKTEIEILLWPWEFDNSWMRNANDYYCGVSSVLNHLVPVLLLGAHKCAVLRHEWDAMTADDKSMNRTGDGIAPGIADHPHVVM
jgi:hypothetical protein